MVAITPSSVTVTPNQNTTHLPSAPASDPWQPGTSTYSEVWRTAHAPGIPSSFSDVAFGWFDAHTGPIADLVPSGRVAILLADGAISTTNIRFQMVDTADLGAPFVGWWIPFSTGDVPTSDGTVYEVTDWVWEDQNGGTDKTRLIETLRDGDLKASVQPPILPSGWTSGMSWGLQVYEFWFNATTPGSPPLRRHPRSDGRGVGPRRHYPPPQSRRGVGG